MKKTDTPNRDPNLKKLLTSLEVPGLPKNFSKQVMESVKEIGFQYKNYEFKVPFAIKVGIPLFIVVCLAFILIFPGNQNDPVSIFLNNFSNPSFLNFFDNISKSIQSIQIPEVSISKEAVYYTLGGIGLIWMYVIFDRFTNRSNKKDTAS